MRQQQIVEATLKLLAEFPLNAVTTRRIAATVGLSQPALFRHFASRDAVLLAVLDFAKLEIGKLVGPVLMAERSPEARLVGMARSLTTFIDREPGLPRLLMSDLGAVSAESPVRTALRKLVATQRGLVTEIVKDGVDDGVLRSDLDPQRAAAYFVGLIQGTVRQWQLGGQTTTLADEVEPLVRFWLEGARAHAPSRARTASASERPSGAEPSLRTLDVRPILAGGDDPLDTVLAELDAAGPTGLLCLTAPFRPAPLIGLLSSRGHGVDVREGPPGVWSVDVVVGGAPDIVDLSELPMPEPVERVLAAAAQLPPGGAFIAQVPRVPQVLLAHVAERPDLRIAHHEHPDGRAILRLSRAAPEQP